MKNYILEINADFEPDFNVVDFCHEIQNKWFSTIDAVTTFMNEKGCTTFWVHSLPEFVSMVNNGNDNLGSSYISYISIG